MADDFDASAATSPEAAVAELMGGATPPADTSTPATPESTNDDETASPSIDFAARAAEAEAELEAEKVEKTDSEPAPPKTGTPESRAEIRDARLQKIIDTKFGGNEEKFVASLYEQQNSAAALRAEMLELKEQLKSGRSSEPPPPPSPEEHPDLGWIQTEISSLEAEVAENSKTQASLINEGRELREQLLIKQGEAKRADEYDKKELEREIRESKQELDRKADQWRQLDARNRRINSEYRELERRKSMAEHEVLSQRENQKQQVVEQKAEQARELQKFETSVDTVAKEYGLEVDGDDYEDMYETVRARAALHIRVNGPVEDLGALTKALCEKYVERRNLQKTAAFDALSRQKTQGGRTTGSIKAPRGPANPTSTPAPSPDKKWTPDFVRARAQKIMGS